MQILDPDDVMETADSAEKPNETPKTSPLRLLILCPSSSSSSANRPSEATSSDAPVQPLPGLPLPQTLIPSVLKSLTSTVPPEDLSSYSGYTSHPPLELRTAYYNADVSIWVDELPESTTANGGSVDLAEDVEGLDEGTPSLETYKSLLLSPEAREVRDVIGAIVLALPLSTSSSKSTASKSSASTIKDSLSVLDIYSDLITAVSEIRDEVEGERGGDVAGVIALTAAHVTSDNGIEQSILDEVVEKWEGALLERGVMGWDVVAFEPLPTPSLSTTNEASEQPATNTYGEFVGIPRMLQVLETVDWFASPPAATTSSLLDDTEGQDQDPDLDPLNSNDNELQREMLGLSLAVRYPEGNEAETVAAELSEDRRQGQRSLLSSDSNPFLKDTENFELGGDGGGDWEEDLEIESLPGLIERVREMREEAAGLPKGEERERFARREVERIMREL